MLNQKEQNGNSGFIIEAKFLALVGLCTLVLGAVSVVWGQDQIDAATKARIEKFEKGPSTIDVSKYPASIQADYPVFSQKCAQCHKLSRPINSDFVLPGEWSRYIKRMMYKPGSGIGGDEAKKIYNFLVYDSSVRKKSQLDAKLKTLTAAESADEQKKIKEVVDGSK